ncbi:MAG: hypothetical protein ACPG4Z_00165 [Chitinophagales bacterium]
MNKIHLTTIIFLMMISIVSCNKDDGGNTGGNGGSTENEMIDKVYSSVQNLNIEVAYEQGAEPVTTVGIFNDNVWSFTELNIDALFLGANNTPNINYDKTIAEMTNIPAQNKTSYTQEDLQNLADQYQIGANNDTEATVFLVFVDGYYNDGTQDRQNVLGVNVSGTFVTAIFKQVVTDVASDESTQGDIEQATVVHEVGHALGLVNNGVPMVVSHQDADHGKHCTNQNCLMFWEVSGGQISSFVGGPLFDNNQVLFGQECLDDTRTYVP